MLINKLIQFSHIIRHHRFHDRNVHAVGVKKRSIAVITLLLRITGPPMAVADLGFSPPWWDGESRRRAGHLFACHGVARAVRVAGAGGGKSCRRGQRSRRGRSCPVAIFVDVHYMHMPLSITTNVGRHDISMVSIKLEASSPNQEIVQ